MKFVHFSDIHFWQPSMDWSDCFYPKRWLGWINLLLKRRHAFPPDFALAVLREILASDADVVVFSGDLTTAAHQDEFSAAAEAFQPLRERWGERFFVIPGNHDRYTAKSVAERRYETWFPYGELAAPERLVLRRDLEENLTLIGCDCSEPFWLRSNGRVRPQLLAALAVQLEAAAAENRSVLLVGHFPFAAPLEHPSSWDHTLLNAGEFAELVAEYRPLVYLHGHKHVRWQFRSAAAPGTICLNSGSAGMRSSNPLKQAGFIEFEVRENSIVNVQAVVLNQAESGFQKTELPLSETAV